MSEATPVLIDAQSLAKVIADHAHPDDWGVDCVYIEQIYERFPELGQMVKVDLARNEVAEAEERLRRVQSVRFPITNGTVRQA